MDIQRVRNAANFISEIIKRRAMKLRKSGNLVFARVLMPSSKPLMRNRVLAHGVSNASENIGCLVRSPQGKGVDSLVEIRAGRVLKEPEDAVHAHFGVEIY